MLTSFQLANAFASLATERLEEYDREVDEGPVHSSMSALVDLIARQA